VALRANDSLQVQGLTKEAAAVAAQREDIHKSVKFGVVAVESWDGTHLPYIEISGSSGKKLGMERGK